MNRYQAITLKAGWYGAAFVSTCWGDMSRFQAIALEADCMVPQPFRHFGGDMSRFQAIALDMDGTLLTRDHKIRPPPAALAQARAHGIKVLLVTGATS